VAGPVLHDAVTLNHFGAVGRMDVLEVRHGNCELPRWAQAVAEEVKEGALQGYSHCKAVMRANWLGQPAEIAPEDSEVFYRLWVGLNDGKSPPEKHKGEAQSIFFAEREGGMFVTDDSGAYDFARRRPLMMMGKVKDSIEVLRIAVSAGELTKEEAFDLVQKMECEGRHFRAEHQGKIAPQYFVL
jgi:predicted nucleic acid-binding protein